MRNLLLVLALAGCASDAQTQQVKLATAEWCVNLQHGATMCAYNPTEKLKTVMHLCARTLPYKSDIGVMNDKLRACIAQKLEAK